MGAIAVVRSRSAESLLDQLVRPRGHWKSAKHFWTFRGHSNANYVLLPSALRQKPRPTLGYSHQPVRGVQRTQREQISAELRRLHEFYWSADAQGALIPEDSQLLRTPAGWNRLQGEIEKSGWPPDSMLSLLALAQHYGIHTRLLDWTNKPLVAAYFAAVSAAAAPHPGDLCIWALNFDWVIFKAWPAGRKNLFVYVVTAPRATNVNLHAQGGIFTTTVTAYSDFDLPVARIPVDELVRARHVELAGKLPVMVQYRLPARQAGRLLRLLYAEGVSAASIYPGLSGVAESLKERQKLWDRRNRSSFWMLPFRLEL